MIATKPMTRNEVRRHYLNMLKDLHLKASDVWVGGGSALIMHDLRKVTNDIDAGCTTDIMERVSKQVKREPEHKTEADGFMAPCDLLPLEDYWMDLHSEPDTKPTDLEMIDGVNCYTLQACLKQKLLLKEKLNRPKDDIDIENIRKKMKQLGIKE